MFLFIWDFKGIRIMIFKVNEIIDVLNDIIYFIFYYFQVISFYIKLKYVLKYCIFIDNMLNWYKI